MIDVGIITAPRKVQYISNSLDSYFAEWNITPHVFVEPGVLPYFNRSKVIEHHNERTLGCVGNWINAISWLTQNTESPFIMVCEDDIEWRGGSGDVVANLLKVLTGEIANPLVQENLPLTRLGFISPYCSKVNAPSGKGWQHPRFTGRGWCGALCMILPRHSANWLVEKQSHIIGWGNGVVLDHSIWKTLQEGDFFFLTHNPSLILHLGEESTFPSNNTALNRAHEVRQPAL